VLFDQATTYDKLLSELICRKSICYFRTKNDADSAISKINSGLVVGGREGFSLCE